jgi:hypothetical protein
MPKSTQHQHLDRARQLTRELSDVLRRIEYAAHGSADVQDLVEAARGSNDATRTLLRKAGQIAEERGTL